MAGVMRAFIIQLAFKLGLTTRIETVNIEDLMSMDAVFVSNALIGLWSVRSIEKNGNQMKCWDTEHSTIKILQDNFPTGFMHA